MMAVRAIAGLCIGGLFGMLAGGLQLVVTAACILALLALAVAGIQRAWAVHNDVMPDSIAFFAEKAIIKES